MPKIIRKSKVQKQGKGDISIRTTIPQGIAEQLELTVGDTVEWIVDIDKKPVNVTVKKSEQKNNQK